MHYFVHRHLLLPTYESVYKRRPLFRYLRELEQTQWLSGRELEEIQLTALHRLMEHAQKTCAYFQKTWERLGLRHQDLHSLVDLQRWPVTDRSEINAHRLAMRTELPGLRTISKTTGGSTGEPMRFELNNDSNDRRTAMSLRGYSWAGTRPGDRQLYLWGVPLGEQSRRKRWKDGVYHWLYNRKYLSTFGLSNASCLSYAQIWSAYRPQCVVAYTSSLYEFAKMVRGRGLSIRPPRSIVVGAEQLFPFQRELIEAVFQAPVFETYGSREFMLTAAECPKHRGMHLSGENLVVEIVDGEGKPTPAGEEGDVVITDLYNYGMPFIRYRNGDRAISGWEKCSCGRGLPLLRQVSGRIADVICTPDGRRISGLLFPHLLKDFPAIKRFQVVQDALDHVALRVEATSGWNDEVLRQVDSIMRPAFGPEMRFDISIIDEIALSRSGKLRVVVNQCDTTQRS